VHPSAVPGRVSCNVDTRRCGGVKPGADDMEIEKQETGLVCNRFPLRGVVFNLNCSKGRVFHFFIFARHTTNPVSRL
jgi:hypothetical protein